MWPIKGVNIGSALSLEESIYIAETLCDCKIKFLLSIAEIHTPLCGRLGPFTVGEDVTLPYFICKIYVEQQIAVILPPEWMTVEGLRRWVQSENKSPALLYPPSMYYYEIANLLLRGDLDVLWSQQVSNNNAVREEIRRLFDILIGIRHCKITKMQPSFIEQLYVNSTNMSAYERRWINTPMAEYLAESDHVTDIPTITLEETLDKCFDMYSTYQKHGNYVAKIREKYCNAV